MREWLLENRRVLAAVAVVALVSLGGVSFILPVLLRRLAKKWLDIDVSFTFKLTLDCACTVVNGAKKQTIKL